MSLTIGDFKGTDGAGCKDCEDFRALCETLLGNRDWGVGNVLTFCIGTSIKTSGCGILGLRRIVG